MKRPAVVVRGLEFAVVIAREFGRIPRYNAEGERLMRAMRNHGHDRQQSGRVWILERIANRKGQNKAVTV